MIEFIKQTKFPQSKQWHYRYFKCQGCGYEFREHLASDVHSCNKCTRPLIAIGKLEWQLSDYEKMKYYGLKSFSYFKDNVRRRKVMKEGDKQKVYLTDSSGAKIGEMPKATE